MNQNFLLFMKSPLNIYPFLKYHIFDYQPSWKICFIDKSSPKLKQVAKRHMKSEPRIRVIEQYMQQCSATYKI